jgi:hypothetical protein
MLILAKMSTIKCLLKANGSGGLSCACISGQSNSQDYPHRQTCNWIMCFLTLAVVDGVLLQDRVHFKQWQELRKHPNGSPPSRQARLSAASLSHCETLFCWGHSQCSRLHLFSAKPTGGVLLIDRRGHRGVGGVRPNAEAKSEGSGRLLRANSEQIHEKSNYCLVELALPACDARSNAEEAASHDQRTSKRKAKQAGTRRSCLLLLFRSLCTPSAQKIAYWHYWPAGRAKKALWDLTEHLDMLTTEQHAISIHKPGLYPLELGGAHQTWCGWPKPQALHPVR